MRYFDYSFLEHGMLPAGLINTVSAIAELRVRENNRKEHFAAVFTRLESVARVQSVKGSNAIEGIVTSEERVKEIVNKNSAPLNHNEAEIAGYRDALALIHQNHGILDVRERDILRLHETMLAYTPTGGGQYKTTDNTIVEIAPNGSRRVRFEPTTAAETAETMEQLVLAFMDARSNINVNQLLLIPCFVFDFLCIHPFADGNGRISRLLSLLLLYKNGFDAGRYISFEEQINRHKSAYYGSLKSSSALWHEGKNNYFPFVENFVTTLLFCYKELDRRFALVNGINISKRERIEATVQNSLLPISKAEICYILPDVSVSTVENVLGAMVRGGWVEKLGAARAAKYIWRGKQ